MNQMGVRPSFATGFAQWPGMSEHPELWEGLVAAYDMSLGQTGDRLIDLSGNGNHGALFGNTSWAFGKFGSALSFDGDFDYVNLGNAASLNPGNITAMAWLKTNTLSSQQRILDKDYNTSWDMSIFGDDRALLRVRIAGGLRQIYPASGVWSSEVGRWYHFAFTYNGSKLIFYIDAVEVGSITIAGSVEVGGLDLRISASGATVVFNGLIDHVLIYNRALIAAEINLLYELRKRLAA